MQDSRPDTHFSCVPLSASTARRWDKEILKKSLPEPELDNLEYLLVDETSIGKGHQYITVVLNAQDGTLLHLAEGKKKASLEAFFKRLSEPQKASIKAVGIDRAGAYKATIEAWLPDAEIVFDKFHVIDNYNSKVIDNVRRTKWHDADGKTDKKFIKGQRYNLFRNPSNLTPKQSSALTTLLAENKDLNTVYLLKEELKYLWTYRSVGWARKRLAHWIELANQSTLEPLHKFAKSLYNARDGILAFCKHPITSARIESFNATIKRIIRKACGYSDLDYLFLKIRQESGGN